MKIGWRVVFGILIVLGLIAIRGWASNLFYDPLIGFFKGYYQHSELPNMDLVGLLLNLSLRFWMNSVLSLILLWLIFQNREIVQLSLLLFAVVFIILMGTFIYLIKFHEPGSFMALFYVRRFLIHPLLLLLLIPAFYFHRLRK